MLIDTHCHIHSREFYASDREAVYQRAADQDMLLICVGTDQADSQVAIDFATSHDQVYAVAGVHPHEARYGWDDIATIIKSQPAKLVGIGEIGLDYHYTYSPREAQLRGFEAQLQLAADYDLPVSFHVRNAFEDFWPIFASFRGLRGVLHSFTGSIADMERAVSEGLSIGLNGISTFTKDSAQQQMFDTIPEAHILLETDAPFLTPTPLRGKINEPSYLRHVLAYHAARRRVTEAELAAATSSNARRLFGL